MDFQNLVSQALDYAGWFSSTVSGTVSGTVPGGWLAVVGFAGAIFVMFVLTSLMSPRR